ncbi:hypothetical protein KIPB_001771 [Kipferlia bialata]|uniref:PH domain-containing protein n=1 Tax=Kipferlia bialata TaxID=797122 RepID=A0A9K3GFQ1_9EUKA|nr:hypothetical protein KIPB_001771 [Kipferlia bialata]|eukprot:g1771.t1
MTPDGRGRSYAYGGTVTFMGSQYQSVLSVSPQRLSAVLEDGQQLFVVDRNLVIGARHVPVQDAPPGTPESVGITVKVPTRGGVGRGSHTKSTFTFTPSMPGVAKRIPGLLGFVPAPTQPAVAMSPQHMGTHGQSQSMHGHGHERARGSRQPPSRTGSMHSVSGSRHPVPSGEGIKGKGHSVPRSGSGVGGKTHTFSGQHVRKGARQSMPPGSHPNRVQGERERERGSSRAPHSPSMHASSTQPRPRREEREGSAGVGSRQRSATSLSPASLGDPRLDAILSTLQVHAEELRSQRALLDAVVSPSTLTSPVKGKGYAGAETASGVSRGEAVAALLDVVDTSVERAEASKGRESRERERRPRRGEQTGYATPKAAVSPPSPARVVPQERERERERERPVPCNTVDRGVGSDLPWMCVSVGVQTEWEVTVVAPGQGEREGESVGSRERTATPPPLPSPGVRGMPPAPPRDMGTDEFVSPSPQPTPLEQERGACAPVEWGAQTAERQMERESQPDTSVPTPQPVPVHIDSVPQVHKEEVLAEEPVEAPVYVAPIPPPVPVLVPEESVGEASLSLGRAPSPEAPSVPAVVERAPVSGPVAPPPLPPITVSESAVVGEEEVVKEEVVVVPSVREASPSPSPSPAAEVAPLPMEQVPSAPIPTPVPTPPVPSPPPVQVAPLPDSEPIPVSSGPPPPPQPIGTPPVIVQDIVSEAPVAPFIPTPPPTVPSPTPPTLATGRVPPPPPLVLSDTETPAEVVVTEVERETEVEKEPSPVPTPPMVPAPLPPVVVEEAPVPAPPVPTVAPPAPSVAIPPAPPSIPAVPMRVPVAEITAEDKTVDLSEALPEPIPAPAPFAPLSTLPVPTPAPEPKVEAAPAAPASAPPPLPAALSDEELEQQIPTITRTLKRKSVIMHFIDGSVKPKAVSLLLRGADTAVNIRGMREREGDGEVYPLSEITYAEGGVDLDTLPASCQRRVKDSCYIRLRLSGGGVVDFQTGTPMLRGRWLDGLRTLLVERERAAEAGLLS